MADSALRAPKRPPDRSDPRPVAAAVALHLALVLLLIVEAARDRKPPFPGPEITIVPVIAAEALPLLTDGTDKQPGARVDALEAPEHASGGIEPAPRLAAAPEAQPEGERQAAAAPAPVASPDAPAPSHEAPPPLPRAKPAPPLAVASNAPPPRPATKPTARSRADVAGPEQAGGGTRGSPEQSADRYVSRVRAEIERNRIYPRRAGSRALEGTAVFVVVVDRSGKLLVLQLQKSSGAAVLDDAGAEMIRRAAPLPTVPPELPGDALELEVALTLFPL